MVYDREQLEQSIREMVHQGIDITEEPNDQEILERIRGVVFQKSRDYGLTVGEKKELVDSIFNSLRRLDILQPLMEDDSITEIMVNGPNTIFVEQYGRIFQLDQRFESKERLENIIQTIVATVNRTVNESTPVVDARLADGSRVHVVLPPIALNGPILTIRKFSKEPMTMERLIQFGSLPPEVADFLRILVHSKYNIFVSGGTGSGKTTMLNALSNFILPDERLITIEDSAELQIARVSNCIRLETRDPNMEGRGQVSIRDLIRSSLRMRPDRIVVGEVRGSEALDMLQAMNTGHDGSLSTGHANSPKDMITRLETMILSGSSFPLEAVRQHIASALDIVIHLSRLRDKTRRVMEIVEVVGCVEGEIVLNPIYRFQETGESGGKIIGELTAVGTGLTHTQKLLMAGYDPKELSIGMAESAV